MDRLSLKLVKLSSLSPWRGNAKLHDVPSLKESIRRYGFRDPIKWESALNGGEGGIVEGEGRYLALCEMESEGEDPPRGISVRKDGWYVPVLHGVDSEDEHEAEAYGVDHNGLGLLGGFDPSSIRKLHDPDRLATLLRNVTPVSIPKALDLPGAPATVEQNAEELRKFRQMRKSGNERVRERTDTERMVIIVYADRSEKESALAKIGLPSDERYVVGSTIELRRVKVTKGSEAPKAAKPGKAGSTG